MEQKLKNNIGLVAYCLAQLGRPYWYGTFGQKAAPWLYLYNYGRFPRYYTATDFPAQYGQKVHDCVGLIKGYFWTANADDTSPKYQSNGFPDVSADMLLARATRKGKIDTIPEVKGVAVFMRGHVGVYIGDGWVVEARGHAYGVVKTRLKNRPWTHWAYIEGLQYL